MPRRTLRHLGQSFLVARKGFGLARCESHQHLAHAHEDADGAGFGAFGDAGAGAGLGLGCGRTAHFVEDGFEDGEAGVDDAEEGFEGGEHGDEGVGVLVVGGGGRAGDCGGVVDAVDGEGADAVEATPPFSTVPEDYGTAKVEKTYAVPMPNMPLSITFFPRAMFKPHRTGIGSKTAVTSRKRLKMLMKRSRDF